MNVTHPLYPDLAKTQISHRLREADGERRRRLARHSRATRGSAEGRRLRLRWR